MKTLISSVWKALLSALAFMVGTMLGAPMTAAVGATLPALPASADERSLALFGLIASVALGLALGPLAAGLALRFAARWAILALLTYVCLGLNTAIEAAIFTTVGGTSGLLVLNAFSAIPFGAALAALFRPATAPEAWASRWRRFRGQFQPAQWAWRLGAAVLAFPVIYFLFGMIVGPFVVDSYRAGQFGLVLPGLGTIVPVQLVRSVLFLAASLPVLVAWRGSRLRLGLALGAAFVLLLGLFGMLQAYWLPTPMRLIHSAEIFGDAVAYAAVLVVLLVRPRGGVASGSVAADSVAA